MAVKRRIERFGGVFGQLGGRVHGRQILDRIDIAGVHHGLQHVFGAGLGGGEIVGGGKPARRLGQGGQDRRLRQGQLGGGLVEIALGSGLHAERALAEIDPVQIEFEDLLLGQEVLDLHGQPHLLQLALDGLVGAQDQVLHQLHGQRRAALHDPAGAHVGHERAHHGAPVHAVMLEEVLVLDRDEGLRHVSGQLLQLHRAAVSRPAHAQHGSVRAQHGVARLAPRLPELLQAVGRFGDIVERPEPADPQADQAGQEDHDGGKAQRGGQGPAHAGPESGFFIGAECYGRPPEGLSAASVCLDQRFKAKFGR